MDTTYSPTRLVIMSTADEYRQKARHCRDLAKESDDRTAANLEMLAAEYDEGARLADEAPPAPVTGRT